jgi:hypothetical protein
MKTLIHLILGTEPEPEPEPETRRECISHGSDCDRDGND